MIVFFLLLYGMFKFGGGGGENEDYEKKPIEIRAAEALGSGFDFASDFRLKFVKRCPSQGRLVVLDEKNKRDVVIPAGIGGGGGGGGGSSGGSVVIPNVSEDIKCDKGDHIRFKSDVLEFNRVIVYVLSAILGFGDSSEVGLREVTFGFLRN